MLKIQTTKNMEETLHFKVGLQTITPGIDGSN